MTCVKPADLCPSHKLKALSASPLIGCLLRHVLSQQLERSGHTEQDASPSAYTALTKDQYFLPDLDLKWLPFSYRNMAAHQAVLRKKQIRSALHFR